MEKQPLHATFMTSRDILARGNACELTFVRGFEEPVSRADPRRHGAGAEVRILSGFLRELQAHGGDVTFSNRYNPSAQTRVQRQHNQLQAILQ